MMLDTHLFVFDVDHCEGSKSEGSLLFKVDDRLLVALFVVVKSFCIYLIIEEMIKWIKLNLHFDNDCFKTTLLHHCRLNADL